MIKFDGEDGLDYGGLSREFFFLVHLPSLLLLLWLTIVHSSRTKCSIPSMASLNTLRPTTIPFRSTLTLPSTQTI